MQWHKVLADLVVITQFAEVLDEIVLPWPDNFVSCCTTVQPYIPAVIESFSLHMICRQNWIQWHQVLAVKYLPSGAHNNKSWENRFGVSGYGPVDRIKYRSIVYAICIINLYQMII